MPYNKFLAVFAFLSLPFLASCSTAMEGSTQQVSFKTVGAEDAYCTVQIGTNDYRYNVRPPQSIWIQKSRKPLFVACTAPGNRVQNVTVDSEVAGNAYLNGLNAGVGAGWDAASGAMYKYPEEVVVDFSGIAAQDSALPSYMNRDAIDPKTQGIEDFGPDVPMLPSDAAVAARYKAAYDEEARMLAEKKAFEEEKEKRIEAVDGGFYGDKGSKPPEAKGGKYMPPKTSAAELKDDMSSGDSPVSVAPLSDAVPQKSAPAAAATAPIPLVPSETTSGSGVVVPQPPSLGKPIFPSSTSF